MKYYTSLTEYNAGVDLHSKNIYLCLMDHSGKILVHENIRNNDPGYMQNPDRALSPRSEPGL